MGEKTMGFDVGDLFGNLFGGTVPTMIVATAQPEGVPEIVELPTPTADPEGADMVDMPDFDCLPPPGDQCPVCGSLEMWWDILGGEHCQRCERAALERSIQWADRAARLWRQAQPRKPTPRITPSCVSGGMVDTLTTIGSGPYKANQGLCGGVKVGKGN
jgi:hypothetical protein